MRSYLTDRTSELTGVSLLRVRGSREGWANRVSERRDPARHTSATADSESSRIGLERDTHARCWRAGAGARAREGENACFHSRNVASGGWCFHAAGRTTHGFPSALAALAACEAQESPQLTVPATHSSMRIAS